MDSQQPFLPPSGMTETIKIKEPVDSQTRQWQLSSWEIIDEVRHRLQGEIPKDDVSSGNITWEKISEPMANQQGINELCMFLADLLNKNVALSYFTPEQIGEMLEDWEGSVIRKLEVDADRMGIRWQDIDTIFLRIANPVWAGVNRARFGGEKQFIEGTEQRRIISQENAGEPKGDNFFSKIPIIGR